MFWCTSSQNKLHKLNNILKTISPVYRSHGYHRITQRCSLDRRCVELLLAHQEFPCCCAFYILWLILYVVKRMSELRLNRDKGSDYLLIWWAVIDVSVFMSCIWGNALKFLYIYLLLLWERERREKRESDLLFHLFLHSLVDPCMCSDGGSNLCSLNILGLHSNQLSYCEPEGNADLIRGWDERWESWGKWKAQCCLLPYCAPRRRP